MIFEAFKGEIWKLFARKRTHIGFAAFVGVELLILFLLQLDRVKAGFARVIERNGYVAAEYLSGVTLALIILLWTVFLLGSLFLALVAGDMVAKEVEDGTLRMMLCRPVSRLRILLAKYAAVAVYTLSLVVFIGATAFLTGFIQAGTGGVFVFAPTEGIFALYEWNEGLLRYVASLPFLALSLMTVSSLGFLLSCLPMKPAAATIATLTLFFVDTILRNIPYFESVREWFLTSRMNAWLLIFEYRIPWDKILENYTWLAAVNLTFLIAGMMVFQQRDFKS